jgi:hypothetical protein
VDLGRRNPRRLSHNGIHPVGVRNVMRLVSISAQGAGRVYLLAAPRLARKVREWWLEIAWHEPDVKTLLSQVLTMRRARTIGPVHAVQARPDQEKSLCLGMREVCCRKSVLLPRWRNHTPGRVEGLQP